LLNGIFPCFDAFNGIAEINSIHCRSGGGMFLIELAFALAIGISVAWGWSLAFNTRGPWNSFLLFFMVIFLFSWGGGSWISPYGPTSLGVSWMPFLFMGLFMALLLTAVTPRPRRTQAPVRGQAASAAALKEEAKEEELETTFDIFFWALIVILAAVIFSNYYWHPRLP
jgi:hypothetical protein